jgi:hypothetical protein
MEITYIVSPIPSVSQTISQVKQAVNIVENKCSPSSNSVICCNCEKNISEQK